VEIKGLDGFLPVRLGSVLFGHSVQACIWKRSASVAAPMILMPYYVTQARLHWQREKSTVIVAGSPVR
jgi:hypothetical protein